MEKEKHAGGRPATGVKRISISISGKPEQIEKLKELAKRNGKNVSQFVLERTGVNNEGIRNSK